MKKEPPFVRGEATGVYVKLPLPQDLLESVADMRAAAEDVIALVTAIREPGAAIAAAIERGLRSAERAGHAAHKLVRKRPKKKVSGARAPRRRAR